MKAILWIVVLGLVVWGVWWYAAGRNNTAGIPATGGQTSGQIQDFTASSTDSGSGMATSSDATQYQGKG